jgi:hypothetical protein
MKYKIILCDDQEEKYITIKELLKGDKFEIIHLKKITELNNYINGNDDFDAIFLDLYYLDDSGVEQERIKYEQIKNLKDSIKPFQKLIIYTQYTEKETSLIGELYRGNIIAEWIDFNDIYLKDRGKVEDAKLRIERAMNIGKMETNGIWILNISDLHFGKNYDIAKGEASQILGDIIEDQLKILENNSNLENIKCPSTLVVSGDISNKGDENEFKKGKLFIEKIGQSLEEITQDKAYKIICPGNHDFLWKLSIIDEYNIQEIDGKKKKLLLMIQLINIIFLNGCLFRIILKIF